VSLVLAALAAAAGVLAQAWFAHRYQAVWAGPWLALTYGCAIPATSLGVGSWSQGLALVALASITLVIASAGHVERLEDQRWKPHEGVLRASLKRQQRWLLARWLGVVFVCLMVDVALGGVR
jgi:hypothetical protein